MTDDVAMPRQRRPEPLNHTRISTDMAESIRVCPSSFVPWNNDRGAAA
jgi:hypothetical protein